MCETANQRRFDELISQCLLPAKPGRRRPLPIVLLWSPGQSGKSELLSHVYRRFYRGRPSVHRHGAELATLRPHEIALQLALHLGRKVELFGRLKFPRLFLGVAAIRGPIGAPAKSREEMIRRTIPDRRRLKQWVRATSTVLLDNAATEPPTRVFIGLVLGGVLATLETAPLLRRRGLWWYRNGLGRYFADPVDALVELAEQEEAGNQASVDEVLCRAFLADLRDECRNRFPQLYDRNEHCLAVLDDADSWNVQEFLDIIETQREQEWDPLLIVAASSRRFGTGGYQSPEEWRVRRAEQARYPDWLENRHANPGWTARYPVTLGGITEAEATACFAPKSTDDAARLRRAGIDVTGVLGDAGHAVSFAHQLTDGHLGGLQLVLRAMTRERSRVGAEHPFDLRGLLDWPVADDNVPLAEVVLRHVLGNWPNQLRLVLLRSSAVRDLGDIALERVLQHEPVPQQQLMRQFRSRDTWVRHPDATGGNGPPTLHPFVRRALLHQLANLRDPDGPTWNKVHDQLHQLAVTNNDRTSEMYHALAAGRVSTVAEMLSQLFCQQSTEAWYENILLAVAKAPLKDSARYENSESHCRHLADEASEGHVVSARLVAALQLHSDPLGDPDNDLCRIIVHELEALANHGPEGGMVFLLKKSDEYRRCHHGGVSS